VSEYGITRTEEGQKHKQDDEVLYALLDDSRKMEARKIVIIPDRKLHNTVCENGITLQMRE
jgi:hypothetical protein